MVQVKVDCVITALLLSGLIYLSSANFIEESIYKSLGQSNPLSKVFWDELIAPNHTKLERELTELLFKWIGPEDIQKRHIETLLRSEVLDTGCYTDTLLTIQRIGYSYELFNVTSTDGYVTQLIRIVNKSIEKTDRKYPPVAIYGGQSLSPALFVQASLAQQHRNRSFTLELVDLGFDVWLVPARGVDPANKGWLSDSKNSKHKDALNLVDLFLQTAWPKESQRSYWSFSYDEIIEFEYKKQLDLIRKVTAYQTISLITYSNGGLISFAFLASQPDYAKHIDSLVSIAPAVFVNKDNPLLKIGTLIGEVSPSGEAVIGEFWDEATRHQWIELCRNKLVRYTACKLFLDSLYGHSDTFNTFIELNMLEYIVRPQPIRGLRQLLQIAEKENFKHFDHGDQVNQLIYNSSIEPEYKLGNVNLDRLYLFSGTNDAIADPVSIERLISKLGKKPTMHEKVLGYNHLDMISGWDVDQVVTKQIVGFLLERDFELINSHPEVV